MVRGCPATAGLACLTIEAGIQRKNGTFPRPSRWHRDDGTFAAVPSGRCVLMSLVAGVRFREAGHDAESVEQWLAQAGLARAVERVSGTDDLGAYTDYRLSPEAARAWMPDGDTSGIAQALGLDTGHDTDDLDTEILAALLASPIRFDYPSVAEFHAAVRVRRRVVQAAR